MYGIAPAEAEQWFPPLFIDHDLNTGNAGQVTGTRKPSWVAIYSWCLL